MTTNVNLSLFDALPYEILPLIFVNLPFELDKVAFVCERWRQATNNQALLNTIRPPRAMGVEELKKIKPNIVDAGIELPLPRSVYREYAKKGGWLVFNPGKVKVKNGKKEIEEVELNTLAAIGNLFKIAFDDNAWEEALKDKRTEEAPHWVWIDTKALGFSQTHAEQCNTAKEEDVKAYPERYQATAANSDMDMAVDSENKPEASKPKQIVQIADINDLVLSRLMEHALFNDYSIIVDSPDGLHHYTAIIRTKNVTKAEEDGKERRIAVDLSNLDVIGCEDDSSHYVVGFFCARKFFGHETLGMDDKRNLLENTEQPKE